MLRCLRLRRWEVDTHHISSGSDRWNDFRTCTEFELKCFFHKTFFPKTKREETFRGSECRCAVKIQQCFLEWKCLCDSSAFVTLLHKILRFLRLKLHKKVSERCFYSSSWIHASPAEPILKIKLQVFFRVSGLLWSLDAFNRISWKNFWHSYFLSTKFSVFNILRRKTNVQKLW